MAKPVNQHKRSNSVTRIQRKNINLILDAALETFSSHGYNGTTLDEISIKSGLSKPNILYYFKSKKDIHVTLLNNLLDNWLKPLKELNSDGDPVSEITNYVQKKLDMAHEFPRESRLFAMEILQGANHMKNFIESDLKILVEQKSNVINDWVVQGLIAKVDPLHLIFSIWATTQHYSDFEEQIKLISGRQSFNPDHRASKHLKEMYTRLLRL
ncbi:MAG: TetR family transcriptional regulator C-terminal domain-containing protein [Paracoccaceae bacterium]|nr:TetR family transcriptional regulator C-terminal domain-containing protein [Paracoccaceae bacterium]